MWIRREYPTRLEQPRRDGVVVGENGFAMIKLFLRMAELAERSSVRSVKSVKSY
jgi:hypothetical protein